MSTSQVVNVHTRNDKTLDLLFTNSPSPVNRVKGMPPIGKADHDIVYVQYDVKAKRIQQAPRKIFLYNRADMGGLRDHLARFRDSFLSSDHSHMPVNDMWVSFKSEVLEAFERFIPTKMTKTKYSLPWIDSSIKRLIRKRDKLYFRARRSSSPDVKNHYKRFRAHVQKAIRDAYWKHISNIFTLDTEIIDPDSPRKNEKAKKFWSFVKSLKKDAFVITSLRENGILKTDTVEKANICNKQFQSAFTRETDSEIPSKGTSPFTAMGEITVDPKGVLKLLNGLKVHKAPGPDGLSARVLKECSSEIAPKVPHKRLLYKLHYYGIRRSTHQWIASWLSERFQKVVLDRQTSDPVPVLSDVPQGSVLGPVLFLIFKNDLPDNIRSSVRLLADDCVLYRNIKPPTDCQILQDDLNSLGQWETDWQMKFNVAKCHSMRVTRHHPSNQIHFNYSLHQQTLEQIESAKYLGITITDNLGSTCF